MMRQVCNRQGRMINPFQASLFFAALLLFIFTVVYRMVKSDSFSTAVATLVESLLMVAFFIFLGIVIAYLLYFLHERIRQGSSRPQAYHILGDTSTDNESVCKPDRDDIGLESDEKTESRPNS